MYPRTILSLLPLICVIYAQTPPGFSPSSTNHLDVLYSNSLMGTNTSLTTNSTVAALTSAPEIGLSYPINTTLLLIIIDPDTIISNRSTTILHFLQTNLTSSTSNCSASNSSIFVPLRTDTSPLSSYLAPAPQAELPPRAHRYIQLLYEQPNNFSIPAEFEDVLKRRNGFSLDSFASLTGLGEVVAANWFAITNTSLVVNAVSNTGSNSSTSSVGTSGLRTAAAPSATLSNTPSQGTWSSGPSSTKSSANIQTELGTWGITITGAIMAFAGFNYKFFGEW